MSASDADVDANALVSFSLHGPGAQDFHMDPHTGAPRHRPQRDGPSNFLASTHAAVSWERLPGPGGRRQEGGGGPRKEMQNKRCRVGSSGGRCWEEMQGVDWGLRASGGVSCVARTLNTLASSGELSTHVALDRERKEEYVLVAKATDGGGRWCEATVALRVDDVNDNAPRFSPPHCAVAVSDNTTLHAPVAVVLARDADQGARKRVLRIHQF